MKPNRITIGGLIGLIAFCGLGMAALHSPSPLITQLTVTFCLTCLLIATLAAIVSDYRPPAIGFALFGWGYLFLVFGPICSERVAPWILSSRILDEIYVRTMGDGRTYEFAMIGHSLFAIAHGVFGGILALYMAGKRGRNNQDSRR